jgi:alpha-glucuronidase
MGPKWQSSHAKSAIEAFASQTPPAHKCPVPRSVILSKVVVATESKDLLLAFLAKRRETTNLAWGFGSGRVLLLLLVFAVTWSSTLTTPAQTADQAWLRPAHYKLVPTAPVRALGDGLVEQTAAHELVLGLRRAGGEPTALMPTNLAQKTTEILGPNSPGGALTVGTAEEFRKNYPELSLPRDLQPDEYWISWVAIGGITLPAVIGGDERGALYGVFDFFRQLGSDKASDDKHPIRSHPAFPIRWVDEWDNPDGSIERGYVGRSIFFENGNVRQDLAPVAEYARLLASIGINGCNINNVNAAPQLLDSDHLKQIARIADAMRPWGVHIAMSVAIASPQTIGGLSTYDPLDPAVKAWWAAKVEEIYTLIPDFAGFTVKADSEGQPGPASFGRTPADAANTLAAALAPHHGVVLYRAFVYNHHLDWRDPKADRARAAYDIFHPLDGSFLPNVIVQTKEGPIDFQAQEPVSPLFAGLQHTAQAMELQITQEYTGQQRHLVYLAPMWKWVLDFDLHANNQSTPVKEILEGKSFSQSGSQTANSELSPTCQSLVSGQDFSRAENPPNKNGALAPAAEPCPGGLVGVAGIGQTNWLNSPLALANLYAFGRLAWDPNLTPAQIAEEWTRQTISTDPQIVATVSKMLLQSWPAYVNYTGPLGLQTLTDITGSHYGPNIESSERNGWGQWHNADAQGAGKDRTVATGSGYAGQYPPEVAKLYEDPATTPDNLLLFFHHVPYTWKLHTGQTVIQYIYDSHYQGATEAANLVTEWTTLKPKIPPALYDDILARLQYQAGHAIVWRDAIVQYFLKLSGIPDEKGRAGHYPGRLEAEDARLTGYKVYGVTPWEDASNGKAVLCGNLPLMFLHPEVPNSVAGSVPAPAAPAETEAHDPCAAEWTYAGPAGHFNIAVQYFDLQGGEAKFTLALNNHPVDSWPAEATLPSRRPNGDNSTRRTIPNIDLKPGDTIRIVGTPEGPDPAALDYIEITSTADPMH